VISPDIGYDPSSIEWNHKTQTRKSKIARFDNEYALIGDNLIHILNAAKRVRSNMSAAAIENAVGAIRNLTRAMPPRSTKVVTAESWGTALIEHLRTREDLAESTRASTFSHANTILVELARFRSERYRLRNPFSSKRVGAQTIMTPSQRAALIDAAKAKALDIESQFRNMPEEYRPFVEQARALVKSGVPLQRGAGCDPRVDRLVKNFRYHTKRTNASPLYLYAYPKLDHLLPFLILITYALAGNIDSISLLRRDALAPYDHPDYGQCLKLELDKPRSGDDPLSYLVRDQGKLSVGWLVRTVLDMTAPLVQLAPQKLRNYAFIVATGQEVSVPLQFTRHRALKRFLRDHGLEHALLNSLRVTRATEELQKSRDPFRVTRLLQHRSPTTTFGYLQAIEAALVDAETIADAQKDIRMFEPRKRAAAQKPDGDTVHLGSHTCSDPWHAAHGTDENGFCANLLWPFND
jgi:hypothetical protein